ncbi:peptidylprolyl isomerase [Scleromatobacter humisilvae]|uniref:peptidylprolyl isomerase n=1 Tax=Scleromatobacter humisilvae TaxID=2897159 RepID=A0A9X1YGR8_9BURK|nr:peptidylprolyl isomerase [Scleromatobacter humisilvae]MCK9686024.1 peptidylprolyl isomerase [Scleromatobacter humisilvae]
MPNRLPFLRLAAVAGLLVAAAAAHAQASAPAPAASAPKLRTAADIVREAPDSAWRRPDPNDVLAMTLPSGIVWIELAPRFAPLHADNIRKLVAQHYFDGLAVVRVQDNFVAQWGDPAADDDDATKGRSLGDAKRTLAPEFFISDKGLKIARLKDKDVFAPVTGFVDGFPVAADPRTHRAWIAHCYGTIGAGRGMTVDSGSGAELYAVIGQSPRGLDLNIAPVARVLQGMELLSSLPRGGQNMGFYDKPEQNVKITKVERLADMPEAARPDVRVFRTDTPQWNEVIESRRNRKDAWYVHPAGAIDLCNITVPVKIEAKAPAN